MSLKKQLAAEARAAELAKLPEPKIVESLRWLLAQNGEVSSMTFDEQFPEDGIFRRMDMAKFVNNRVGRLTINEAGMAVLGSAKS